MKRGAYLVFVLSLFSHFFNIKPEIEIIPVHTEVEAVRTTISLTGDILMDGSVRNQINKNGMKYPWEYVEEYFNSDDLTIGNLETSITKRGEKWPDKQFNFRSDPENLKYMKEAGIDMVSLSNNHILDYGYQGLVDTIDYLDKYQILYAGGGKNLQDAKKGIITEVNDLKIGFLSYSRVVPDVKWYATKDRPGIVGAYDPHIDSVLERIEEMKSEVDILILSIHWGIELSEEPRNEEINLARKAIDAGVDIIMGHHPHVLQGIEIYKGRPIFYSLGNFVFGTKSNLTSNTMIAQVNLLDKEIDHIRIIPLNIIAGRPVTVEENEFQEKIDYLNKISGSFNTIIDKDGKISINRIK